MNVSACLDPIIRGVDALRLEDLPRSDDPTAHLAYLPASLSTLPITICPIPGDAELLDDVHPTPRVLVAHAGHGRRWYRQGAATRELSTRPGMIEIYEGGLAFDECRWAGTAGRCVMVEFADADVQSLTHGELERLSLRTQHEVFDPRIRDLTMALAGEVLEDLPNGRLYIQGLCVALMGMLDARYARHPDAPGAIGAAGGLAPRQRRQLLALIGDRLGDDLSLVQLAHAVQLSPHHFSRVFKATFGTTPHRYVLQRRLDAAVDALRLPANRSIAEIALECGFASQAHMTDVMRRHLGVTPSTIRRGR